MPLELIKHPQQEKSYNPSENFLNFPIPNYNPNLLPNLYPLLSHRTVKTQHKWANNQQCMTRLIKLPLTTSTLSLNPISKITTTK